MNYIEWALQRGAELWHAREEALKKRLSLVPEGPAQKKAADAQLSEEEAAAQDAEMSGGAETVAEAADDPVETAAVRLGQKLGLGATQEDDGRRGRRRFLPIWRALRRRTLRFCARGRPRARTMRPTG